MMHISYIKSYIHGSPNKIGEKRNDAMKTIKTFIVKIKFRIL